MLWEWQNYSFKTFCGNDTRIITVTNKQPQSSYWSSCLISPLAIGGFHYFMSLVLEANIYWRDMTYKLSHILILFLKHLAKCNFLNQLMEFWHDAILVFLNVFWLLMTSYFYFLASWSYIFVMALLFQKATKRVTFVRSLIREVPASARSRRRARQAEHFSRAGKRSASAMQRLGGFLFPRRPTLTTAKYGGSDGTLNSVVSSELSLHRSVNCLSTVSL